MILIKNLLFRYPGESDFKLEIEELRIEDRQKCCIIGPSGSGKTTLLNIITGIYKPISGTVRINEMEINRKNDREIRNFRIRNIGYIFQDFGLIDYLNVEDNVLLPFYISPGLNVDGKVRKKVDFILRRLDIGNKSRSYIARLSQGEKQRVAIARALVTGPDIVIGDEATGNLDVKTAEVIMNLLMDVVEENKATLLFVTHNVSLMKHFGKVIDINKVNKDRE